MENTETYLLKNNPDYFRYTGTEHQMSAVKLDEITDGLEPRYGTYRVEGERLDVLRASLESLGLSQEGPSEEAVKDGIANAKELAGAGKIKDILLEMPFTPSRIFQDLIGDVRGVRLYSPEQKFYIDPNMIEGAEGFESWAGRGKEGSGDVSAKDGPSRIRRSIDQITDYATRDTQLPEFDTGALDIVLTDEGARFFSGNAHRVSAAKIRQEPLGTDSVTIYDARSATA